MDLAAVQDWMRATYFERDDARGVDATFRWFTEEVGELAAAIRRGERSNLEHEFADVLAWLSSLANLLSVDLEAVMRRHETGCPKCGARPCECPA